MSLTRRSGQKSLIIWIIYNIQLLFYLIGYNKWLNQQGVNYAKKYKEYFVCNMCCDDF